ncbi:polysaccharide pyruvyl transferase family protein [Pseudarthrobacter sp. J64]|uniref:polysaccharide pyruvyl transferase family protein n=1 Tax=Pseudarthrobacter sp. J64 TaxID=3116485 RepID=UPI002E8221C1|nr:polysaccharide pyruvyl transferase family protein [Pseudarthrobacter sp. J64]MEE2568481.1 polysaccharide pyruvyl transferase family protein [Pseudarthrobacter sp. J64]
MIVVDGVARRIPLEAAPIRTGPGEFDLLESSYDNAGNIIHAEAPFSLWDDASGFVVDGRDYRRRTNAGFDETIDFANRHATHFVLSATNFLQFEGESPARRESYKRLMRSLDRLEIRLVVMGLGVQAQRRWNPKLHRLPAEAIEFMSFLGEKCSYIGLRGEFSASIFRDYAGVKNTRVIGCPSFFQRPESFTELRAFLSGTRHGSVSFNATNLNKPAEFDLARRAIDEDSFWVEVSNESLHRLALNSRVNPELAEVPAALRPLIAGSTPVIRRKHLVSYFSRRYRRFRDFAPWWQFNREEVRFSYGTRFHGNMATLLAGRPALWVTHDSRTLELATTLHLPAVSLTQALESSTADLEAATNYEATFDNVERLFHRFNDFLAENDLPVVQRPFVTG